MKKQTCQKGMRRWITGLFALFLTTASFSQQSSLDLPDYFPVSPNAASLGSYGLYPVNKNLGNTSVNIPIYTLTEKSLSVPINLNYNMSGIRLNDLASWVGLGWSLNAGGAIIRNTKGLPDLDFYDDIPHMENFAFNETNWDYLVEASQGSKDTAPDEYVFNALGISGSFYFDRKSQEAVFDDVTQIRITVISKEEIHATLQDGTMLIFGKDDSSNVVTEKTVNPNLSSLYISDPTGYISAWYLTKLISKDRRHSISFEYKTYLNQYGDSRIDDYSMPVGENIRVDGDFPPTTTAWRDKLSTGHHNLSKVSKKYLDKIVFDNGHIQFESSLGRMDLQEDYKLDAIKVYTDDGTQVGKLIDEYHFTYEYFQRSGGVFSRDYETAPVFFDSERQIRSRESSLKLTSMYRGPLPTSDAEHSFIYNESTSLPLRCTTAQDSWGYPNNNTGSLLPRTQATATGLNTVTYFVGDGDRSPDEQKMKAAVLEKITYPTGGSTVFELEANRLLANEQVYENKSLTVRAFGSECDNSYYPHTDSKLLEIPSGSRNIRASIFMSPISHQGSSQSYVAIGSKQFYRPTPNSSGYPSDSSDGLSQTIDMFFGYNLGSIFSPIPLQADTQYSLEAFDNGFGSFGAYDCSMVAITISWEQPGGVREVEKLVGGLRIKSISDYDGESTAPVRIKKFEYGNPNLIQPERNRGHLRGIFTFNPSTILFSQVSTTPHFNNNLGGEPIIEYGKVTEYNYSYFDDDNDLTTPQDNGKIVSYFQNIAPTRVVNTIIGAIPFEHPQFSRNFVYQTDRWDESGWTAATKNLIYGAINGVSELTFYESTAWKRGKLSREETYKRNGNTYIPIKEVDNQYENIASLRLFDNFIYRPIESTSGSWDEPTNPYNQEVDFNSILFAYMIGEKELGRRVLKKSTTKVYDTNGLNPITTSTDYFYDNPAHLQLTRMETINSLGNTMETLTTYPDDIIATSSVTGPDLTTAEKLVIDKLKGNDLHRISEPVQVETIVKDINGTVLSRNKQRTRYRDWGNNLVFPDSIKSLKGQYDASTNPMEDRVTYHAYNDKGNPLEVSQANGPHIYYIWGYNDQYPIAKIENFETSDATAIQGLIDAAVTASNADNDHCEAPTCKEELLRDSLDAIRSHASLNKAQMSSYTYDPMVGVTSMTDSRGYIVYYEYDDFNRLKEIRDKDNNLVTDYEYHYKDQ
ncbi:hypothetical protein [Ulvibacterium marinum]|uniref:hypothetical protein n=1 Tax=Ulvibacterium marinum TaxID=2419782 RepID=UPI00249494AD|nr:hypothetical protein [Ulvibacterium marinum]